MKTMLVIVVVAMLMVGEDECDEGDDDDAVGFLRTRPPLLVHLLKRALLV